jgi:hypothetical protein
MLTFDQQNKLEVQRMRLMKFALDGIFEMAAILKRQIDKERKVKDEQHDDIRPGHN